MQPVLIFSTDNAVTALAISQQGSPPHLYSASSSRRSVPSLCSLHQCLSIADHVPRETITSMMPSARGGPMRGPSRKD